MDKQSGSPHNTQLQSNMDQNVKDSLTWLDVNTKRPYLCGGAKTKMIAADITTAAGVQMIIVSLQSLKHVIIIIEWSIQ